MDRRRIELHAARLEAHRASTDDDLTWWEATVALERALRRAGLRREAAMAAHSAAQAVLTAAARAGVSPTPDVTAVARSAADAARLLTAEGLVSAELAQRLSNDWNDLLVQPLDRQTAVPVTSETRRV